MTLARGGNKKGILKETTQPTSTNPKLRLKTMKEHQSSEGDNKDCLEHSQKEV